MAWAFFAALGIILIMLGVDLWDHDLPLGDAIRDLPHQIAGYIGVGLGMAWQYKVGGLIVIITIVVIIYLRRVPEVKRL